MPQRFPVARAPRRPLSRTASARHCSNSPVDTTALADIPAEPRGGYRHLGTPDHQRHSDIRIADYPWQGVAPSLIRATRGTGCSPAAAGSRACRPGYRVGAYPDRALRGPRPLSNELPWLIHASDRRQRGHRATGTRATVSSAHSSRCRFPSVGVRESRNPRASTDGRSVPGAAVRMPPVGEAHGSMAQQSGMRFGATDIS